MPGLHDVVGARLNTSVEEVLLVFCSQQELC